MFLTRALTVLIALPLFAAALFLLPNAWWAVVLVVVLAIAAWEWARLSTYGAAARIAYAAFVVASAVAAYFVKPADAAELYTAIYAVSCAFWFLVAPFWLAQQWTIRNPVVLGVVGWIALLPMWLALVQLQPRPWVLLMFMSVIWIADTAAYLAGRQWGRRKLAPAISPGKSWEGVAGAAVALAVYFSVLWFTLSPDQRILPAGAGLLVFAALLVLSIEGDLFESWMKRQVGMKDSGQLLPGHGGILDRVDGLTSTMPFAALALHLVGSH